MPLNNPQSSFEDSIFGPNGTHPRLAAMSTKLRLFFIVCVIGAIMIAVDMIYVTLSAAEGISASCEVGFDRTIPEQIARLAKLAKDSGMDGVVASPLEIELIRDVCGKDFKILTPGIRPAFAAVNDQKRIATPAEALRKGADYLVIGRPITAAENRREAFLKILEECRNA